MFRHQSLSQEERVKRREEMLKMETSVSRLNQEQYQEILNNSGDKPEYVGFPGARVGPNQKDTI